MTIKELSQYRWLVREIEMTERRIAELEESAAGPSSPDLSGDPHGTGYVNNKIERQAVAIVTLWEKLNRQKAKCIEEKLRLETYIETIPDSQTRQIFVLRFVDGLSWRQVAFKVGGGNTDDSVRKVCFRYLQRTHT